MHYEASLQEELQADQLFYKFSILDDTAQNMGSRKKNSRFLSSFCETRWYSTQLVCIDVASYHKCFQHCVNKSKLANKPPINKNISNLMDDDYQFAINK